MPADGMCIWACRNDPKSASLRARARGRVGCRRATRKWRWRRRERAEVSSSSSSSKSHRQEGGRGGHLGVGVALAEPECISPPCQMIQSPGLPMNCTPASAVQ